MADSHDTTVLPDRQLGGRVVPCPTRRALMGAVPASVAATVAAAATVYGQGPEPGTLASDDLERLATWDAFNERFSIAAAMLKTDEMPWRSPLETITDVMGRDLSDSVYPYRLMLLVRDKAGMQILRRQAGLTD